MFNDVEDREKHRLKQAITTAGLFGIGYSLKDNYLKNVNFSKNKGIAFGIGFALLPTLFNEDREVTTNFATIGLMAASINKSSTLKKIIINSEELYAPLIKNLKNINDKYSDLKEFMIESKQKLLKETDETKGFLQAAKELSDEVYKKFVYGTEISKSKAYSTYKEISKNTEHLSMEEFLRLGKKVPYQLSDYITARRKFDRKVGGVELGSGLLTTLGYFSRVRNGKIEIDPLKFIKNDMNNISSLIDFLDNNISDISTLSEKNSKKIVHDFLQHNGMGFFSDALKNNVKTNNNQVSYKQFMKQYSNEVYAGLNGEYSKYFNHKGEVKYLDLLGDQIFSENIAITKKGKFLDATWYKPSNYIYDSLKFVEGAIRPFFKSLPFGERSQFPIFDTLNLETKLYNSLYSNQIGKFYVDRSDNLDLIKTQNILDRQIKNYRIISDKYKREKLGYKSISQAMFLLNKTEDLYNPGIKTEEALFKAIRMLETKKTKIDDLVAKTGGTLNKGSVFNMSGEIDKAYNKFYFEIDKKGDMSLKTKTLNKGNTIFHNNKMIIKKNGVFEEQKGQYVFDLSRQSRIIQAKKAGEYFTTDASKVGRYIEEENVPTNFNFFDFKNIYENRSTKEAIEYVKNSDLNMLPFKSKNGFKDSDNIVDNIKEPFERIGKYLKINNKKDRKTNELLSLFIGIEKQNKSFYRKYNEEIEETFEIMMNKYNKGMQELNSLVTNNSNLYTQYKKKFKKTSLDMVLEKDTYASLSNFLGNEPLSDNIKDALKMKKAFEISVDKYSLFGKYNSITDIGVLDKGVKKLKGDLFTVENFKEDIILNTFGQFKNYKEFKNSFGEMFENNIMLHKETLFNKNRITNININKPNIVKRAFSDGFKNSTEFSEMIVNDKGKLGTNLGMYITKGLESFENSLATVGIPKLNPENMKNSLEYFANVYAKRILPVHLAVSTYSALNSAVDATLPDSVPIFGKGITAAAFKGIATARMALQIAINSTGLGFVFRKVESMFPGILTDNGLLSPLQLSYTNQEMYSELFEGKEVEVKKNRFWFSSGRQKFEGGELKELRPHLLYLGQQRTSGIYDNKIQRFFRQDFLPTKIAWTIVDPYLEERINEERRPVAISGDMFNDELPIFGGFINLAGKFIKRPKKFRKDEWYVSSGVMRNPEYEGQENTPEFIHYDDSWKSTRAFSKAFQDIGSIIGMRGYIAGQVTDAIFGSSSSKDEVRLETINDGETLLDKYNALELGGMFGTTESLRRILGNNPVPKTVSPFKNNSMPDWMPKNYFKNVSYGNVYNEMPFGEFVLPGKVYEEHNTLHPDDTGEYGVVDRLKILSKVAPFSKEFRHTKRQALSRIHNMSNEEKQIVYQSLSFAEKWRQRDVAQDTSFKVDTTSRDVTIKRIEGPLEFYGTDNKRYKLAGLDLSYLNGKNDNDITREIDELTSNFLFKGNTLKGVVAKDPITSVKTDNAGEYIELYAPVLDQFTHLKKDTHLRRTITSDLDITNYFFDIFKNAKKSAAFEKIWGDKDTLHRYYYENILDPSFKNWDSPIESFIDPILDTASTGTRGYFSSLITATKMGDFGDPTMPLLTTASFVKGKVFGANTPSRIKREDYLKNMIEYSKSQLPSDKFRGNFNSSIYNISENDGLSKMKNYLTDTEKKYLDDIVNEVDERDRQKMYDVSTDRMKVVLNELWKRQAEYADSEYQAEQIELPTFEDEKIADYNATNITSYNDALFKREMGFDLATYEEQTVNLYGTKHLKDFKRETDIAEYIDTKLGRNNKQKVLSTIFDDDLIVFGH